jgi:hypothetical protein
MRIMIRIPNLVLTGLPNVFPIVGGSAPNSRRLGDPDLYTILSQLLFFSGGKTTKNCQ